MPRFAITAETTYNPTANLEILEIIEADDMEKAWAAFLGGYNPARWGDILEGELTVFPIGDAGWFTLPIVR